MKLIMLVACAVLLAGCSTTIWRVEPAKVAAENEYMSVQLSPINIGRDFVLYDHFAITVKNKTDKLIEINWNKTNFSLQGMSRGGFVLEGMMYKDKDITKQSDVIFPNSLYAGNIYPSYDNMMQPGEIGAYITFNIDGKEIHEKLVAQMISEKVSFIDSLELHK